MAILKDQAENSLLRKIILGLLVTVLLLLPFHPFLVTVITYDLNISSGVAEELARTPPPFWLAAWKEAVMLIIIVLIAIYQLGQKKSSLRLDLLDYLIIAFVIWSLLTAVFATGDLSRGIFNFFDQLDAFGQQVPFTRTRFFQIAMGVRYSLFFLVIFWFLRHLALTRREKSIFFRLVITNSLVVIVIGFFLMFNGEERLYDIGFSQPPPFGGITQEDLLEADRQEAIALNRDPDANLGSENELGQAVSTEDQKEIQQSISYCQKVSNTEFCRMQSTMSGPNQFAAYLLIIIPLAFLLAIKENNKRWRLVFWATCLLGSLAMLFTLSRGGWIGLFFAGIAAFVYIFHQKRLFQKSSFYLAAITSLFLALPMFLVKSHGLVNHLDSFQVFGQVFYLFQVRWFWILIFILFSGAFLVSYFVKRLPVFFVYLLIFIIPFALLAYSQDIVLYAEASLPLLLGSGYFWFFTLAVLIVLTIGSFISRAALRFLSGIMALGFLLIFYLSQYQGGFFWDHILRPSSTQGHAERLADGIYYLNQNPLGLGLGDAGPASRYSSLGDPFISENWFLQIGLETGFVGLILMLAILSTLAYQLIKSRNRYTSALALALLGLSFHALVLHTFESFAVATTFFALAAISIAEVRKVSLVGHLRQTVSKISYFWRHKLLKKR